MLLLIQPRLTQASGLGIIRVMPHPEKPIMNEGKSYCARHPKEETALRCASCGTPICPKCMVSTPVGMKCPNCGRNRKSVVYQARPERLLLAAIVSLAAGAVTALIGEIGFFVIFVSIPYGYFAGSTILKASGMKRGLKIEMIAGAGMVMGALGSKLLPDVLFGQAVIRTGYSAMAFGLAALLDPFFWLAVVIATACAISKIRYL